MNKITLLSPAKDLSIAIAAINHGADAVYIGGPGFGAREKASNSIEDIEKLCRHAAIFNAKVNVTLNTILFDNELDRARKIAYDVWNAGADALIIQDMALLQLDLPPIPLHASTQCNNMTAEKVKFLENVGFSQVILGRELTLNEIKEIRSKTTVALEYFIHGALCVCQSGQCYMSHVIGNRSANRGACAQPCRLQWNLLDENNDVLIKNRHLLSLKDLNNSKNINELIDAGITTFKIEGRLKDADYVKNTTAFYRKVIDDALEGRTDYSRSSHGDAMPSFTADLDKTFTRGYCQYFLKGREAGMDSPYTPKSMGEYVGKMEKSIRNGFIINTEKTFHNGDGLCFLDENKELQGFNINQIEGNALIPNNMKDIKAGTEIFRNFDIAWQKQVEQSKGDRKIKITLSLTETDKGYKMSARPIEMPQIDADYEVFTDKIDADNPDKALDNIKRKAMQWGDTIFNIVDLKIDFQKPYFITASILGEMKRQLVQALTENLIAYHKENREQRVLVDNDYPYPDEELSYLGNVINEESRKFYEKHGVKSIQDGLEKSMPEGEIKVMTTRHCVRFSNGLCSRMTGKKATPLFLENDKGRFRLDFDCKNCVMNVIFTNQEK